MATSDPQLVLTVHSLDVPMFVKANEALDNPLPLDEPFETNALFGESFTAFLLRLSETTLKSCHQLWQALPGLRKPILFEVTDGKKRVKIEAGTADDIVRLTAEARKLLRAP